MGRNGRTDISRYSALFVSQFPTFFRHANLPSHVRPIGPMLKSDWQKILLKQKCFIWRAPGIEPGTSWVAVNHSIHYTTTTGSNIVNFSSICSSMQVKVIFWGITPCRYSMGRNGRTDLCGYSMDRNGRTEYSMGRNGRTDLCGILYGQKWAHWVLYGRTKSTEESDLLPRVCICKRAYEIYRRERFISTQMYM